MILIGKDFFPFYNYLLKGKYREKAEALDRRRVNI